MRSDIIIIIYQVNLDSQWPLPRSYCRVHRSVSSFPSSAGTLQAMHLVQDYTDWFFWEVQLGIGLLIGTPNHWAIRQLRLRRGKIHWKGHPCPFQGAGEDIRTSSIPYYPSLFGGLLWYHFIPKILKQHCLGIIKENELWNGLVSSWCQCQQNLSPRFCESYNRCFKHENEEGNWCFCLFIYLSSNSILFILWRCKTASIIATRNMTAQQTPTLM